MANKLAIVLKVLFTVSLTISLSAHSEARPSSGINRPDLLSKYHEEISRIIAFRAKYTTYRHPFNTKTIVLFTINRAGSVIKSELRASSGSNYIDNMALDIARIGYQFPPIPEELNVISVNVPVTVVFPARP